MEGNSPALGKAEVGLLCSGAVEVVSESMCFTQGVTCAWWTAAMTTALPERMSLVLSRTSHLLLAEAQTTSESKLALLIASALLDADLQEFCMHLEDSS